MNGWELKKIGDVLKLEYGKPLPKEKRDEAGSRAAYGANGILCRTNEYYWDKPSIIVGRKGSAGEITLTEEKFWPLDVTYFVVFDDHKYDLKFLFFCLQCLNLTSLAKGVKPGINRNDVYALEAVFPPLPEQKSIVAILDEAFAEIAAAVANTEKNLANARELFEGVLESAFNGKLTSKEKPFGEISAQIVNPVKKGLPPIDEDEIPFRLPMSWRWVRLGSEAEFENGDRGKNYPNKSEYVKEGIPWINTGHIQPDGSLSLETMNYITKGKFNSLRSGKIQPGDLVYCLRGATIGKTALVEPFTEGAVASSLVIIRPGENVLQKYMYYFLISRFGRSLIKRFDNGAAQPNLGAKSVAKYVTPLPPLPEQKTIVENLNTVSYYYQQLESIYQQKLQNLAELKQSILQKAFAGELTSLADKTTEEAVA